MNESPSDALVLFGASGDLACRQILPRPVGDDPSWSPHHTGHRRGQAGVDRRTGLAESPSFPESSVYRIDHFLGKEPVPNQLLQLLALLAMDDDRLRVVARPVAFEGLAVTAFDEIRRAGRSSVSVTVHLLDVIRDIAGCVTREPDRVALLEHAGLIMQDSLEARLADGDRGVVEQRHRDAVAALELAPA